MSKRHLRFFTLSALIVLAFYRVGLWQKRKNSAQNICVQLEYRKGRSNKIRGSLVLFTPTQARLLEARIQFSDQEALFFGDVFIRSDVPLPSFFFGNQVELTGALRCKIPFRNASQAQDKLEYLSNPVLSIRLSRPPLLVKEKATFQSFFSNAFSHKIDTLLKKTPSLLALSRAVWIGDMSGFPETMQTFYKEVGLLPTLALSGQHVGCLLLLMQLPMHLLLRLLLAMRSHWYRLFYRELARLMPLFGSLLLLFTSPANPPMQRTVAMTLSLLILRLRKFENSTLQVVSSTAGILIIWDPSLLANIGFFLSVVATALLAEVLTGTGGARAFAIYLYTSTSMPLLILPLCAFFFSKVAWTAPIHVICLAWLWDLFIIPFGFLLPLLAFFLPNYLLSYLDQGWMNLCDYHLKIAGILQSHYTTFLKPTWAECAVIEGILLILIFSLRARLLPLPSPKPL